MSIFTILDAALIWIHKKYPERKYELLCMRLENMVVQHPNQDNSRKCDTCGYVVGLYPDSQEAIKTLISQKKSFTIICHICAGMHNFGSK
jgi:hypothetical protein